MKLISLAAGQLAGRLAVALALGTIAAGCDLLPSDGPSTNAMLASSTFNKKVDPKAVMRFALVGIDARVTRDCEQFYQPVASTMPDTFQRSGNFGQVGIGDVLRVTIWEPGEGLFGKEQRGTDITVRVDVDGTISLPYAGRFPVSGRRLSQIESTIVSKLEGQAVQPQATVMIADNASSSASVQGDVTKPGPYPVTRGNERVLDMVAMAGGAKFPPYESSVRLTRGRSTVSFMMQELIDQPETFNVPVAAGDAVLVTQKLQKFIALGAVAQPGEQIFRKSHLTLADGLAQAFGLDAQRSDAKGVYLFRREPVELAQRYGIPLLEEDRDTVPIVYQLDLKDGKSFFVMSQFPVRPNDIVFVSTAPLAEAVKFFQILSGATATVAIPRTLGGNFPSGR